MEPHDHWRRIYETKRPEDLSWSQASPSPSLEALERIGAKPSMSFVDVGAGQSSLAEVLLDRGWKDLSLVDVSEPALDATRRRLGDRAGRLRWEVVDVRHWRPDRSFDIWHDRAVFHFLTGLGERTLYKRALAEGTHAGSYLIIATFALDGPEQCSGLPVRRYDAAGLALEFAPDFHPVADWLQTHVTPWGTDQRFQWAILRRV